MTTRTPAEELQNRIAANINLAIALRYLNSYVEMLAQAKSGGADVSRLPEITGREIGEHYHRLVEEWVLEEPTTAVGVNALVDFAGVVFLDSMAADLLDVGTIGGRDADNEVALRAFTNVKLYLRDRENVEYSARLNRSTSPPP